MVEEALAQTRRSIAATSDAGSTFHVYLLMPAHSSSAGTMTR